MAQIEKVICAYFTAVTHFFFGLPQCFTLLFGICPSCRRSSVDGKIQLQR